MLQNSYKESLSLSMKNSETIKIGFETIFENQLFKWIEKELQTVDAE
jgi:hypothetical protein